MVSNHKYYLRPPMKEVVVSGIRPTGFLHLGNYFGALRNYVRMQEDFTLLFFCCRLAQPYYASRYQRIETQRAPGDWQKILPVGSIPKKLPCLCRAMCPKLPNCTCIST